MQLKAEFPSSISYFTVPRSLRGTGRFVLELANCAGEIIDKMHRYCATKWMQDYYGGFLYTLLLIIGNKSWLLTMEYRLYAIFFVLAHCSL